MKNASVVTESPHPRPAARAVLELPAGEDAAETEPAPAPEPQPVSAPAFKEWEAIVEALGHGAQIVILRKGGIAEGRQGFQARHPRFCSSPPPIISSGKRPSPSCAATCPPPRRAKPARRSSCATSPR
ncbi:MAG: DUF1802 family protein [Verrucomicrobiota bacterium]